MCKHLLVSSLRLLSDPAFRRFREMARASLRQRSQYLPPLLYVKARVIMSQLIVGLGPKFSLQISWESDVLVFSCSFLKEALWLNSLGLKSCVEPT